MTNGLYFRLTREPPMPPPDADFSFRIVFEKGAGDPRRIFDAASELIDGFEELDEAVTGIVDATLRPLMVLEDIEAGSIRVWLSSFLKKIDDQGLREGEIKRAIGPALIALAVIGFPAADLRASRVRREISCRPKYMVRR
jgi:hypothetical protein